MKFPSIARSISRAGCRLLSALAVLASLCPLVRADWMVDLHTTLMTAPGSNIAHYPAINSQGDVAFVGNLLTSPNTEGVYRISGNVVTPIRSGGLYQAVSAASINDAGQVAYTVNPTFFSGFGIYRSDGLGSTTIAAKPGPFGVDPASNFPSIAADGSVAFILSNDGLVGGSRGTGVFVGDGAALRTVASTPAYIDLNSIRQPFQSDNGIIAYEWRADDGRTPILVTDDNGDKTTITSLGSGVSGFTDYAVNDAGKVAFVALYGSGDFGLFESNGSDVTKLVTNLDAFNTIQNVALNNQGQVAILAKPGTESYSGIYLGLDPVHDKIVAVGDALLGSTIKSLGFGNNGFNDLGQIVFWARLADSREGIFVATSARDVSQFAGDANGDHIVDFTDLGILLNQYERPGVFSNGDFDSTGIVDFTDLGLLLNHYDQSAPTAAAAASVPEPSSLTVCALGAIGLVCYRVVKRRK